MSAPPRSCHATTSLALFSLLCCLLLLLLPTTAMLHAAFSPSRLRATLRSAQFGRTAFLLRQRFGQTTHRFSTAGATDGGSAAQQQGQQAQGAASSSPSPEALATFARVFPALTDAGQAADRRPVVLFDGVCAFCNRGIDTVLRLDVNRKLRFAPLQSELGRHLMEACGRDPDDLSSMLVVEGDGRLSIKSDAAIRIAEVAAPHPALGAAFEQAARMLLPQAVRDQAYDTVAENRYSILGKRDTCRLPDPGDDRFLA